MTSPWALRVADAILLAALVIHNLRPGPLLFSTNPEIVNTIMATHLAAHVAMFLLMTGGCLLFARLMLVPRPLLFPMVIAFCLMGAYAESAQVSDVWIMLGFGAELTVEDTPDGKLIAIHGAMQETIDTVIDVDDQVADFEISQVGQKSSGS